MHRFCHNNHHFCIQQLGIRYQRVFKLNISLNVVFFGRKWSLPCWTEKPCVVGRPRFFSWSHWPSDHIERWPHWTLLARQRWACVVNRCTHEIIFLRSFHFSASTLWLPVSGKVSPISKHQHFRENAVICDCSQHWSQNLTSTFKISRLLRGTLTCSTKPLLCSCERGTGGCAVWEIFNGEYNVMVIK